MQVSGGGNLGLTKYNTQSVATACQTRPVSCTDFVIHRYFSRKSFERRLTRKLYPRLKFGKPHHSVNLLSMQSRQNTFHGSQKIVELRNALAVTFIHSLTLVKTSE